MEANKEGIDFTLKNFATGTTQRVVFTEKDPNGGFRDGTTNEEVVNMLIERLYFLQKKNWSQENAVALILLKNVRQQFAKRLGRKIEKVKNYNGQASN